MKWFFCLSIIIGLSVATFGQDDLSNAASTKTGALQNEQLKSEVDRLFNSMLSKDQAWALYLSGKYGMKEYVPLILDSLQRSSNNSQDEHLFICRVAFDSLIQLEAEIPASELMPLYKKFPDEVMILLARAPKENQQALLAIAKQANPAQENRHYWLAACNLLAEIEAKGLAAHLLSEVTINLAVHVTDQTGGGMGEGLGSAIGCGLGGYRFPEGFPPIALYSLIDEAKSGRVVVAPGVHTIYFQRTVMEPGRIGGISTGSSHQSWHKNDYLLEYFAALLKTTVEGLQFTNKASRWLEWKNSAHYKQMVLIFRTEMERGYNELKSRLIERDLLSASESESLAPKIAMKVYDSRGDKTIKLPQVPGEVKSLKND
jgi:hypothetical protein